MAIGKHIVPPDCGRRLIPVMIDRIAEHDPSKTFISTFRTINPEDGYDNVSFKTFATAINRCAWWLEGLLGKGIDFPTLYTQLPPHDLRHAILVVAAAKVGYKMFFSSPVNTIDSHCALLDKLDCQVFLMPAARPDVGVRILQRRQQMREVPLPESALWLSPEGEDVPVYPFTKTFEEAQHDPFMVFHSSGTTGTPKPLVFKHGTDAAVDAYQLLPLLGDHPAAWSGMLFKGKRVFTCQPFFHACGTPFLMNAAIYHDFVGVIMPSILKFDVNIISAVHQHGDAQVSYLNPASIIAISQDEQHLAKLEKIEIMSYAGGALPAKAGNIIAQHASLLPIFGSTECSSMPVSPPPTAMDWNYYRFSPFFGGEFRYFDGGYYELVIVRDQRLASFQTCFFTVDDAGCEYHTRDLFQPHPTHAGWWRHCGRKDDVLVFSDGRKLNPVRMEAVIETSPLVDAALLVGAGKERPVLLIQAAAGVPLSGVADRERLLDALWPSVEAAMADAPKSGLVLRDAVVFTDRENRPMVRSGLKITVQRMRTTALYQAEIDEVYASMRRAAPVTQETAASVVLSACASEARAGELKRKSIVAPHYVYGFESVSVNTTALAF